MWMEECDHFTVSVPWSSYKRADELKKEMEKNFPCTVYLSCKSVLSPIDLKLGP